MNDMMEYWRQELNAQRQDFNKWQEEISQVTIKDKLFRSHDENTTKYTTFYDLSGNKLGVEESEIENKYIVINNSSGFTVGNMLIVPNQETLDKIHSGKGNNQKGIFLTKHTHEYGFIVSLDGSSSRIVKGDVDRITEKQWKPAVDDINRLKQSDKRKNAAYTVHLHPAIIGSGVYGEGKPGPNDCDPKNFFDKGVNIILFFVLLSQPPVTDNDYVRYITLYNEKSEIFSMKWNAFKRLCTNIYKQQE